MFGRKRGPGIEVAAQTPVAAEAAGAGVGVAPAKAGMAGSVRAVSAPEELLRRAEWEALAEGERAALLAPFTARTAPVADEGRRPPNGSPDVALQEWVARIVGRQIQPEAAEAVRAWLADGSPDGHFFLGGRPGQGRTSLACSLARAAMAERPAPPAYCYVPDPDRLEKVTLLALPKGTGADFGRTLAMALAVVGRRWDDVAEAEDGADTGSGDDGGTAAGGQGARQAEARARAQASAGAEQARRALIAAALAAVAEGAPDAAADYLARLRSALEARAAAGDGLPFDGDGPPVAHVTPEPDDLPSATAAEGTGAPVIAAAPGTGDLADALLRANGGVLVLQAADVMDVRTWGMLAGALRSGGLALKDGWPPVPVAVRVVLVGTGGAYKALAENAEGFERLFRYEAWCNWDVPWTRQTEAAYAAFADGVCARYGLPRFDPGAVARFVEEAARRCGALMRSRLCTDLLLLHDLAQEAGRVARRRASGGGGDAAAVTTGADVALMLERRRGLQAGTAARVREAILTGTEMTPTVGVAIGQINALGIMEAHPDEATFAVPMRISATVSAGRDEQVIDVEREAEQADANHVRGELTMEGYLNSRYGQVRPISLLARIRFEQEHGATGGDSASAAELFALLSALAQTPLRRSYAVTGAVGQYGEIQPIGGVNTKIEGFWAICRSRRAAGEAAEGGYGVLIPAVNARDLMLREEVARSIAGEGWFHIFPIATVDEGLALLTGLPAEEVHRRVEARLQRFAEPAARGRSAAG